MYTQESLPRCSKITRSALIGANINPGPESFYLKLQSQQKLDSKLDFIDMTLAGTKVVTYQALVKVNGKTKFSLINSLNTTTVYDEVVMGEGGESDWTLLTLRVQTSAQDLMPPTVSHAQLRVECAQSSGSVIKVWWHQAWGGTTASSQAGTYPLAGGLANAGFARTPAGTVNKQTYPWAVNAMSVKAASRFQLPLLETSSGKDAAKMGWAVPTAFDGTYDLQDGEAYMDGSLFSVMGRAADKWYQFVQPDRVLANPADNFPWEGSKEKNLIYDTDAARTVTLKTDLAEVPRGSIVRVFNFNATLSSIVTVKVGTATLTTVAIGRMCEFLFYVDGSAGRWLVVQDGVVTKRS